jgi:class 3 adenylate cyclase
MASSIIRELDKIVGAVSKNDTLDRKIGDLFSSVGEIGTKTKTKVQTVVVFDLVESTSLKVKVGHDQAMRKIMLHDKICRLIVKRFGGLIIKELGDGMLVTFDDPLKACLAAINVKEGASRMKISTKAALVLGLIERTKVTDRIDIFGTPVDRVSRIEKFAHANQILIDRALHDAVITFLMNYNDLLVGPPMMAMLKGHGNNELFEISNHGHELKNSLNIPFQINENGRLRIDETAEYIKNAKQEVFEIGRGLRTLTGYYYDKNPGEFKNYVRDALSRGVNFKCMASNPELISEKIGIQSEKDGKYFKQIQENLDRLRAVQREFENEKLSGSFEIFVYEETPLFHALCVDIHTSEGRMAVSNYLPGVEKSRCPVMQFSRTSNPAVFNAYLSSINYLLEVSHPLDTFGLSKKKTLYEN